MKNNNDLEYIEKYFIFCDQILHFRNNQYQWNTDKNKAPQNPKYTHISSHSWMVI